MENMTLRYNCVALAGVNQPAEIQKDGRGYRRMLLGALNVFNSENIFYAYNESKHVFERSNIFMRKVAAGNLYGERDHPAWEKNMTEAEFIDRNEWIEITNTAFHVRDVEVIVTSEVCNGLPVVEIWGWIKPEDNELGRQLEAALNNPDQNVCFSLRAIVRQGVVGGVRQRRIDKLVTFDWVIEDGLRICNKYSAMVRGSKVAQESTRTYLDRPVSREACEEIIRSGARQLSVATESRRRQVVDSARDMLTKIDSRPQMTRAGLGARAW
ncbi:putative virion structural protein [Erwinia phage vB_EamM_Phobos]|uniref:head maturation protease n=1 Tax=Erwinia phage vB_EamM_Phobos TaxID=1883377 RepID=UPI00081C44DC|nr:head maturation protease [Erwinia phage vB_EamM_Phobos]ANZ50417.1 putative virion structural protein [Erwinia phage vB_EamM_Phobos]